MKLCQFIRFLLTAALLWNVSGCRGQRSIKPPVHIVRNMDTQEKFKAFGENSFFMDGRNMRELVEGTVPREHLNDNDAYYTGKNIVEVTKKIRRKKDSVYIDTQFVKNPEAITMELLLRGQDRFNIFCAVCHGLSGSGKGINVQKGFIPPTPYSDQRIIDLADGNIFDVVTNGIRTMPRMGFQIPVKDRWAITAYIRALQRSFAGTIKDIPDDERDRLN